jgi:hypothetical protein
MVSSEAVNILNKQSGIADKGWYYISWVGWGLINSHRTHWIGGWVGPRTVLDAVVERKIPSPRRESNPITPIVQPVAQRIIHVEK